MRKAIGAACPVLLGLGQAMSGWQSPLLGYALIAGGLLLGVFFVISSERVRRRIPYIIVRRDELASARSGPHRPSDPDLTEKAEEIEAFIARVGRALDGHALPTVSAAATGDPRLSTQLRDALARGRRIARTAPISAEGACAPFETWEHELRCLFEDAGRHDLATRLEAKTVSDYARGFWSHRSATRGRIQRKLRVLGELLEELSLAESARRAA